MIRGGAGSGSGWLRSAVWLPLVRALAVGVLAVGVSAGGGVGRGLGVGGFEGGFAVAVGHSPSVIVDVVVAAPAHEHQISMSVRRDWA